MDRIEMWENFQYQFLETGWFDHDDRVKTVEAMRRLSERIPGEIYYALPIVLVVAPSQFILGQVYPEPLPGVVLYLSPTLEAQEQQEVDFTVAHEFAHIYLGHQALRHNPSTLEDDADKLAESWGFTVPERRKISEDATAQGQKS